MSELPGRAMDDRSARKVDLKALASRLVATITRRDPFGPFRVPNSRLLDVARQQHLATLELPIDGRRVLEVGAGIGLHTGFFEARGCEVVSTDGRLANVLEIRRRFPYRRVEVFDVEHPETYNIGGHFDVIYCYGLLYHLSNPERALDGLASLGDLLLLETCVTPGDGVALNPIREHVAADQALRQIGCRPTRRWVIEAIRSRWGHAYTARTQPDHPQFPTDWRAAQVKGRGMFRAIFVASRTPTVSTQLSTQLADIQPVTREASR